MTTKEDIRGWLNEGKEKGATHVVVVCDTFDYEDFPVFVNPKNDVHETVAYHRSQQMQRVMEVYCLGKDLEIQLNTPRNFCFE